MGRWTHGIFPSKIGRNISIFLEDQSTTSDKELKHPAKQSYNIENDSKNSNIVNDNLNIDKNSAR